MLLTSLTECILLLFLSWVFYHAVHFVRILFKLQKFGKAVDQFPMDKKHWLKGHIDKLSGQGEESLSYFLELVNKYPRACGLYLLNFLRPYVVVHHPETVRSALKGMGGKPFLLGMYRYGRRWLGGGLFLSNGSKWLRNRKLLENAFHAEALKHYVKEFNEATEVFLSKLSDLAKRKTSFDILELAALLTFDVVLRCAFSYKSDVQTKGEENAYVKATNEVTRLWMKRQFEPWKHFDFVYWRTNDGKTFSKYCDDIHDFSNELIRCRRRLIKEHPDEADMYHDFLNILLRSKDEDGVGLTDEEIRDEINTCISGAVETTSTTLSWALHSFASNPEHQNICQKEIDDLLQERQHELLSWYDLQELPYITACLKESLRLYGVPEIEREMDEDVIIDGKLVPAGCPVMINLFNLHRNPGIWENPSKFQPERFLHENRKQLDPFAFIPFAAGKRNCIGQAFGMLELKVIVARTLRRYNFTATENLIPIKTMAITLKSSNGIHLEVSERETEA